MDGDDDASKAHVNVAMAERAALERAADAANHPLLSSATQRLGLPDRLRAQLIAARRAAWPIVTRPDTPRCFHEDAVFEGVTAAVQYAREPAVSLASMRRPTWYTYHGAGVAASEASEAATTLSSNESSGAYYARRHFAVARRRPRSEHDDGDGDASSQSAKSGTTSVSRTRSCASSHTSSTDANADASDASHRHPLVAPLLRLELERDASPVSKRHAGP